MLSEIRQRKTNTVWYHLYVESKKYNKKGSRVTDTEDKLMAASGCGEWEVQTASKTYSRTYGAPWGV